MNKVYSDNSELLKSEWQNVKLPEIQPQAALIDFIDRLFVLLEYKDGFISGMLTLAEKLGRKRELEGRPELYE